MHEDDDLTHEQLLVARVLLAAPLGRYSSAAIAERAGLSPVAAEEALGQLIDDGYAMHSEQHTRFHAAPIWHLIDEELTAAEYAREWAAFSLRPLDARMAWPVGWNLR